MIIPYPFFHGCGLVRATRWVDSCLCFVFRGNYRKKMEFWYVQCSHGQIAFYSYFLGQTALYLWKVICGKKKRRLHSYTYGCFLVSGAEVHTMHFLSVFKLLFEKRGGEIFGHHYFPSGDQKFILDRQLASVFKKLISDPEIVSWYATYQFCWLRQTFGSGLHAGGLWGLQCTLHVQFATHRHFSGKINVFHYYQTITFT